MGKDKENEECRQCQNYLLELSYVRINYRNAKAKADAFECERCTPAQVRIDASVELLEEMTKWPESDCPVCHTSRDDRDHWFDEKRLYDEKSRRLPMASIKLQYENRYESLQFKNQQLKAKVKKVQIPDDAMKKALFQYTDQKAKQTAYIKETENDLDEFRQYTASLKTIMKQIYNKRTKIKNVDVFADATLMLMNQYQSQLKLYKTKKENAETNWNEREVQHAMLPYPPKYTRAQYGKPPSETNISETLRKQALDKIKNFNVEANQKINYQTIEKLKLVNRKTKEKLTLDTDENKIVEKTLNVDINVKPFPFIENLCAKHKISFGEPEAFIMNLNEELDRRGFIYSKSIQELADRLDTADNEVNDIVTTDSVMTKTKEKTQDAKLATTSVLLEPEDGVNKTLSFRLIQKDNSYEPWSSKWNVQKYEWEVESPMELTTMKVDVNTFPVTTELQTTVNDAIRVIEFQGDPLGYMEEDSTEDEFEVTFKAPAFIEILEAFTVAGEHSRRVKPEDILVVLEVTTGGNLKVNTYDYLWLELGYIFEHQLKNIKVITDPKLIERYTVNKE